MMAKRVNILEAISRDRFGWCQYTYLRRKGRICYPREVLDFCQIRVEEFMTGLIGELWYELRNVYLHINEPMPS